MTARMKSPRFGIVALLAATVAIVAIGWTGSASSKAAAQRTAKSVTVKTKTLKKLGVVLVTSTGRTLYMFKPDKQKKVTCKRSCAAAWPPLKLKKGQKAMASGAVRQKLLGSDPNPSGGRVVTYNGWPLYRYAGDSAPGQARGQATNLNGGLWYVMSPSGKYITKKR